MKAEDVLFYLFMGFLAVTLVATAFGFYAMSHGAV
jgi:hypothetical protein